MLVPEDVAQFRRDRNDRMPGRGLVRVVLLLTGLCIPASAIAQGILELDTPLTAELGLDQMPLGQAPPLPPPVIPTPGAPTPGAPPPATPPPELPGTPPLIRTPSITMPTTPSPGGLTPGGKKPAGSKHVVAKELNDRVNALAAKREFVKALAMIDEALKTDSGNAELYRLRAIVQCRGGNIKGCLEDASRGVDADPNYLPSYLFRATLRINYGLAKEALGDCETVMKRQPAHPLGYNCRGLANRALKEFAQAIADFEEALRQDSKFALAHYNIGVTHLIQDKYDEAIGSLSASIELNPKHDDSFAQRGRARVGLNDVAAARSDFAKAMSLNRTNFVAIVGMQALHVGKALDSLSEKK